MVISGHLSDIYNGIYQKAESWNGYAHFAKEDRTAHLYYLDASSNYW